MQDHQPHPVHKRAKQIATFNNVASVLVLLLASTIVFLALKG